jgi:eukaryotic-like serine/threonine-protein kinase
MALNSGSRLGPYEILAPLGAGGMGEVYRARDTRLERTVAIKILPQQLSNDPVRKQRFEREAKTISSLNHPHICVLYDVGRQGGVDYLVMECVDGETLAKRLEKGPLPLEQVLKYGAQIADALDKAHRSGVVHRDLKPGNIMLTATGAKLLDFGLAKPAAALASVATLTGAVTQSSPMTEQGAIVGTFQYMSPEQVEGKDLDGRSDIFSLGAVLYEMLTCQRAFEGKSQLSVASAILEKDPLPISTIKPLTPPTLDHAIRRCLAKDPDERWQTARDLTLELKWIAEAGSQAGVPAPVVARRQTRERIAWVAAALLGIFAVLLAIGYIARAPAPPPVIISQIAAPDKGQFVIYGVFGGAPALSPDGQRLAFTAQGPDGKELLWMRSLGAASAQPLAGTEQATFPFWSPDSRYVGYFANGKLNRIDASGGPPFAICDAGPGRSGTWSRDGTILFSPAFNSPLFRVAASGGVPVAVTKLNPSQNEISHRWPQFLPDGKHFLFFDFSSMGVIDGTYISSLDGSAPGLVVRGNASALYAPPGYLLYLQQNTLMAQRFDVSALQLRGDAVPLAEQVSSNHSIRQETVTASDTGLLVYARGLGTSSDQLQWLDRSGKEIAQTGEPGGYGSPRISPDGKNLAVSVFGPDDTRYSIWVYDLVRGTKTRRTFDPGNAHSPQWSPDGKTLVFVSTSSGTTHIYQKAADGSGDTTPLVAEAGSAEGFPFWSFDGRYVLFNRTSGRAQATANYAIWALPTFGDRKAFLVLQSASILDQPALSPDGKWLAYRSTESGVPQIYIAPFPGGTGKWQVSKNGGIFPRWRRDGRELFYLSLDNKIMAAEIGEPGSSLTIGEAKMLFQGKTAPFGQSFGVPYDVTPDGGKFVVVINVTPVEAMPMTLVTNWPALLKKER